MATHFGYTGENFVMKTHICASFMIMNLVSSVLNTAHAEETCDSKALAKEIVTLTGDAAAQAFGKMAKCDVEKAKRFAPTTVLTFIPSEIGYASAITAMQIGQSPVVVDWMNQKLQPSEQKNFLRQLGDICAKDDKIQAFFVNTAKNSADVFWKNRYYQYVTACHVPALQEILSLQLDVGLDQGTSQYFAVASAYARITEYNAIPKLQGILQASKDADVQSNMIAAIFEAVDETTKNYSDDKKILRDTQVSAVEAIMSAKETLLPTAIQQARLSLGSLEAETEADMLAGYFYADQKQSDGSYMWGLVVAENATCKKGKQKQNLHSALVLDTGHTWADQLKERVTEPAEHAWEFKLATDCKGQSEFIYVTSEKPFANMDEYSVWKNGVLEAQKLPEVKAVVMEHDNLQL